MNNWDECNRHTAGEKIQKVFNLKKRDNECQVQKHELLGGHPGSAYAWEVAKLKNAPASGPATGCLGLGRSLDQHMINLYQHQRRTTEW